MSLEPKVEEYKLYKELINTEQKNWGIKDSFFIEEDENAGLKFLIKAAVLVVIWGTGMFLTLNTGAHPLALFLLLIPFIVIIRGCNKKIKIAKREEVNYNEKCKYRTNAVVIDYVSKKRREKVKNSRNMYHTYYVHQPVYECIVGNQKIHILRNNWTQSARYIPQLGTTFSILYNQENPWRYIFEGEEYNEAQQDKALWKLFKGIAIFFAVIIVCVIIGSIFVRALLL